MLLKNLSLLAFATATTARKYSDERITEAIDSLNLFLEIHPEFNTRVGRNGIISFLYQASNYETLTSDQQTLVDNLMTQFDQSLGRTTNLVDINYLTNYLPFWGYGCYCNYANNTFLPHGYGAPVDKVDALCKDGLSCYHCTTIDAKNENSTCDPATVNYSTSRLRGEPNNPNFSGIEKNNLEIIAAYKCDTEYNKEDPCRLRVCMCETSFIERVFTELTLAQGNTTTKYQHANGFNKEDECRRDSNAGPDSGSRYIACCGLYPNRHTYTDNSKDCCDDKNV